jgi:hypothetical protein
MSFTSTQRPRPKPERAISFAEDMIETFNEMCIDLEI